MSFQEEANDYLTLLNEPQRAAVVNTKGPVMIIAGAGSGKTRVLTYRIAHLIKQGVDPFNILSLTFTNKAAREMRERIQKVVGPEAKNLWMGTFHSVFAKILRVEAGRIGYPNNFTIYDMDDAKSLIKSIVKEMNLDDKIYKPGMILNRISAAKNNLITADKYGDIPELTSYDESSARPKIAQIYSLYAERCFRAGAMDFDDLLMNTHKLLTEHPEVLNKYQHYFQYVMVDEFQDTNQCQYKIIRKLAAAHENVCIVGDDAQSIYAFRGATIKNILNFERDYPDLKVFKLEQNYRSTQTIVNAAGSVIAKNKDQLEKKVWTDNDLGERIKVYRNPSDNEEGKRIAENIFEEKMRKRLNHKDFAILYRTNAQSRAFEEALRRLNIPYRIYGGLSFYQRKEVKDMIAYLRLMINHNDEEALKRIINYPTRGIGKTTIDRLILCANEAELSLWDTITNADKFQDLRSAAKKLKDFQLMIRSFASEITKQNAYDLAMHVAKQTNLLHTLYEDKTVEGISRYENMVELLNGIKEFTEDDTNEQEKTLPVYLQDIALLTDADKDDPDADNVTLMTIHSAKGLEFKHVYVVGLEENLFPSQMALNSRAELEEERRLFYVATTRAEEKLTLSYATTRFRFGQLIPCEPSRFIEEIDPNYLDMDKIQSKKFGNQLFDNDSFKGKGFKRKSQSTSGGKDEYTKFKPKPQFEQRKPAHKPDPNFVPDDTAGLQEGMFVTHQRFGKGKVIKLEGQAETRKATILFDDLGEKQIVLKFAKLKIDKNALN